MIDNVKKFDALLKKLQDKANEIHYNIDDDSRYKELCELVTDLDEGEIAESLAGDKLMKHWFLELIKCLFPDFDKIVEIINILGSI